MARELTKAELKMVQAFVYHSLHGSTLDQYAIDITPHAGARGATAGVALHIHPHEGGTGSVVRLRLTRRQARALAAKLTKAADV